MIQFNLLPDVKLKYVKTERLKRTIISICTIASAAALAILLLLVLTVDVWQKKSINDLTGDVETASQQLKAVPDLNKVLTVQNQLGALDELHSEKPAVSRLFSYLTQVTPAKVTLGDLTVNYEENSMEMSADAPTLKNLNVFVDGLKFTKYTQEGSSESAEAFSGVVVSDLGRNENGANYTITMQFDPIIFDNTQEIDLQVPNIVTTRSVIDRPTVLFDQKPAQQDEEGQL